MKQASILASLLLSTLVLSACASTPTVSAPEDKGPSFSRPMAEPLTREYRACTIDTDCVLAQNGCCDCANGGEDIAIYRDQVAAFTARFECHGCTEIGGDCGRGAITCENKLCTYRESAR